MSSEGRAPAHELVQAATGPVLLILLGFLFLVNYWGGLSFTQSWPILLIVFGCFKLLERLLATRAGVNPRALTVTREAGRPD